jgi:trehalose/maltose hydrolase-like predicted phosphorylase
VAVPATAIDAMEALLTVGNGYLATRGAAPEATADGIHYPATYAAGAAALEKRSAADAAHWTDTTQADRLRP